MDTDLVSLKEAAKSCGVGLATMTHWVRDARLRVVRAAGEKWIKRSCLSGLLRGRDLPVPFEFEHWPRILIVEDENDLRLLIERHMRKWWYGAEIRGAADGERALEILAEYRPDLAVVDVNLPGKDGLSLCRDVVLDPKLAQTKVLVMTASRAPGINERAFADGAVEFMLKPFEPEALRAAAQRLLGAA